MSGIQSLQLDGDSRSAASSASARGPAGTLSRLPSAPGSVLASRGNRTEASSASPSPAKSSLPQTTASSGNGSSSANSPLTAVTNSGGMSFRPRQRLSLLPPQPAAAAPTVPGPPQSTALEGDGGSRQSSPTRPGRTDNGGVPPSGLPSSSAESLSSRIPTSAATHASAPYGNNGSSNGSHGTTAPQVPSKPPSSHASSESPTRDAEIGGRAPVARNLEPQLGSAGAEQQEVEADCAVEEEEAAAAAAPEAAVKRQPSGKVSLTKAGRTQKATPDQQEGQTGVVQREAQAARSNDARTAAAAVSTFVTFAAHTAWRGLWLAMAATGLLVLVTLVVLGGGVLLVYALLAFEERQREASLWEGRAVF